MTKLIGVFLACAAILIGFYHGIYNVIYGNHGFLAFNIIMVSLIASALVHLFQTEKKAETKEKQGI